MIAIQCPRCGQVYQLSDDQAGRQVQCSRPDCRQVFVVAPSGPQQQPQPQQSIEDQQLEQIAETWSSKSQTARSDRASSSLDIARALYVIGALYLLFFLHFFRADAGSGVNNLGLLFDRLAGCVVGTAFFLAGSVFYATSREPLTMIDRLIVFFFLAGTAGMSAAVAVMRFVQ